MKKEIIQLIAGTLVLGAALFLRGSDIQPYVFLASYLILGWKVIYNAVRNLLRGDVFNENFLMSIATGGAFIIGEYPEASAVMLFYLVGESFQDMAVHRSRKSISDLMDIRPDFAHIRVNGELQRVAPETVKIGDVIVVKPGEKIPLDGVIIEGESMLDTKALTGESVPRSAKPSDTALSGCINLNGVLAIEVTKIFGESTAAKIIDLVENASGKKAPAENFITAFSRYYTPAVVGLAALLAVLPPLLFGGEWADWIHRALVFLVISCPCALVISIPLGFFCGIGAASRNGVLVKGGNYLEALNNLDVIVFDKTGTLTKGVFDVTGIYPTDGFTSDSLLEYAAQAEAFSNHPIAKSVLKAYGKDIDKGGLADYREMSGHGTCVTANGVEILAGNGKLMQKEGIAFDENNEAGTRVYVAANGKYAGCIVISDEIKPDSLNTIAALKKQGVKKTVMLTGDDRRIAETTAKKLSIDEVHAQLLPGEKVAKVEELLSQQRAGKKLAFAGDGINDAPVLARADIGIAMGALGSDAAIEAADVVLMTDELTKLVVAIKIAKRTKRIIVQNIVFALAIKGIFLVLGALGVSGMWQAVFADTGVSLLAVLNALRINAGKLTTVELQRVR
jgi:Cd2+/Zn2+-exporting ATPase